MIPAPRDLEAPVAVPVPELAHHLGTPRAVALACDLLDGADPAVRERLTDEDEAVRRHAAQALERLEQRLDLP